LTWERFLQRSKWRGELISYGVSPEDTRSQTDAASANYSNGRAGRA